MNYGKQANEVKDIVNLRGNKIKQRMIFCKY